mgnify:CR=1 FL=1
MSAKENLKIAETWMYAMNRHDLKKMESLYADDAIDDEVAEPEVIVGKEKVTKAYKELFQAFPDCKATITNRVAGGDHVLLEIIWEGTNKGEFRGTPATDKRVKLRIAYIFRIRQGKIHEIREYYDAATYLKQVGTLPEK